MIVVESRILSNLPILPNSFNERNNENEDLMMEPSHSNASNSSHNRGNEVVLTEARYKKYHEQIIKKLNRLAKTSLARAAETKDDNENENILPEFPFKTKEEVDDFEALLKQSKEARDAYVRVKHIFIC